MPVSKKLRTKLSRSLLGLLIPVLARGSSFHVATRIPLPGGGGSDAVAADATHRKLYIAHEGEVLVFDLDKNSIAGKIVSPGGAHGIAVAAEIGRGFITARRDNQVLIFDLNTQSPIEAVKVGSDPGDAVYDRYSQRIFVFNHGSEDVTAMDAATGYIAGTVALGGKPAVPISDGKGNVYVALEDRSELVRLDPKTLEVLNHWPLAPCTGPFGLALDGKGERVFAACASKVMAVIDAAQGNVITTLPIGDQGGDVQYDPDSKLLFLAAGEGTLSVISQDSATKYSVVQSVKTERGVRRMALDPKTHRLFLPAAQFGPAPGKDRKPGPSAIPGTLKLLVVSP